MTLRGKLLWMALSVVILPWAGWQFVRQTDVLLRRSQEQALLASAQTVARAIKNFSLPTVSTQPPVYVHALEVEPRLDGYSGDWANLPGYARFLSAPQRDGEGSFLFGEKDAWLYLIVHVKDATRTRVDATDAAVLQSDHAVLTLSLHGETRHYLLASAAPGSFEVSASETSAHLPQRLNAAWQDDASGYSVELRLPRDSMPERMGLTIVDAEAVTSPTVIEPREVMYVSRIWSQQLSELIPSNTRARLLQTEGWVLADTQDKKTGITSHETDTEVVDLSWWELTLYRLFAEPALSGSSVLDGVAPQLDAPEVWQALSGVPATSWRRGYRPAESTLSAVVPLWVDHEVRAVLVLEHANAWLPFLANRAWFGLAGLALLALVIVGVTLLVFGARLSSRVRRLRDATEHAVRVPSYGVPPTLPLTAARDELGDLARSFYALLEEVSAYTHYLQTLASKLSHELHTPLAVVRSSLDNLEAAVLPESARPYLLRARQGAERLSSLVRAMSEASRMERAMAATDAEDFDLRTLVMGCAEGYRSLMAGRAFVLNVPDQAVPLHGAPDLLAQALDKLVDNARSFTPDQGWISLTLRVEGARVVLCVANSGSLLPASMQERLFESLVSVREDRTRSEGEAPHLGFGLYVVRLIAELHQGSAQARNLAQDEGVEFKMEMMGMPRKPVGSS